TAWDDTVQYDTLTDDVGVAAEPLLPETVAQDHHRIASRGVAGVEHASDDRCGADHREHFGRHRRDLHARGFLPPGQRHDRPRVAGNVRKRARAALQLAELGPAERRAAARTPRLWSGQAA